MLKNERLGSIIKQTESKQNTTTSSKKMESNYAWLSLTGGSYNYVWRSNFDSPSALVDGQSYQGPWVLKYAIPSKNPVISAMSDRERAVRLWNEINHDLPKAGLYKKGWVSPYLENTRLATDDEIAQKVVEIYKDKKRIVVDAATKGNFLTVHETGKVVLVDVDLALKRSGSHDSINFAEDLKQRFASYWTNPQLRSTMPKTLEATQNLLYLEDSLTKVEIDTLFNEDKMSIKNIKELTWPRINNVRLTYDVIYQIGILNDLNIPLKEAHFVALSCDEKDKNVVDSKSNFFVKRSRHTFFSDKKIKSEDFEAPESLSEKSVADGLCVEKSKIMELSTLTQSNGNPIG